MFGNFLKLPKFYIKFGKWSYSRKVVVPIWLQTPERSLDINYPELSQS